MVTNLIFTLFLLGSHRSVSSAFSFPLASNFARFQSSLGAVKVVWFREHALRIHDNEAVSAAVNDCVSDANNENNSILPVYLWNTFGDTPIDKETGGTAKDVFVANALHSLNSSLDDGLHVGTVKISNQDDKEINEKMIKELVEVCRRSNSDCVYYLKSHHENKYDLVATELIQHGITPRPFGGSFSLINYSDRNVPWEEIVLEHPWRSPLIPFVEYVKAQMREKQNTESSSDSSSKATDRLLRQLIKVGNTDSSFKCYVSHPIVVDELIQFAGKTEGGTIWGQSICKSWPASERYAKEALDTFLQSLGTKDGDGMKRTHLASKLSPYLARGMISPRQVYDGITAVGDDADTDSFVRRICWRDYTYAVTDLYPDVTNGKAIRDGYDALDRGINFDGMNAEKIHRLDRWKKGQCGFPLIDAGMRQLEVEGWMPQKVRLACSTFLVESLGISWREGMDHFADFLVDYDKAINSNMWMNAGCVGLDPYYVGMNYKRRMYWDKDGMYVRKWCPELALLPDAVEIELGKTTKVVDCLYEPWASPPEVLEEANVRLGSTYPEKVCDDRKTRAQFFKDVRILRSEWPSYRTDDKKRDLVSIGKIKIGLFTPRALQERRREVKNNT